jgi:hypothetical protein
MKRRLIQINYSAVIVSILLMASSCTSKVIFNKIENFDTFYNRFHNDTIFQLSRVNFPLEGFMVDHDGEKNWDKSNWSYLKIKVYDVDTDQFKVYYKKTSNQFIQKSWIENSGFLSEYRFKPINGKWYLVYALEQNL